tara:strand:+ start:1585 stop:1881 length:297 start_codon:yes stop_codon:yes gene_type:complete
MALDHDAVRKAYPSITLLDDSFVDYGLDASGNKVSIVQSKVDAARTALNDEAAKIAYQDQRKAEYPDWGTQLDYIYHNGIDKWKTDVVDPVKNKYPKP